MVGAARGLTVSLDCLHLGVCAELHVRRAEERGARLCKQKGEGVSGARSNAVQGGQATHVAARDGHDDVVHGMFDKGARDDDADVLAVLIDRRGVVALLGRVERGPRGGRLGPLVEGLLGLGAGHEVLVAVGREERARGGGIERAIVRQLRRAQRRLDRLVPADAHVGVALLVCVAGGQSRLSVCHECVRFERVKGVPKIMMSHVYRVLSPCGGTCGGDMT